MVVALARAAYDSTIALHLQAGLIVVIAFIAWILLFAAAAANNGSGR